MFECFRTALRSENTAVVPPQDHIDGGTQAVDLNDPAGAEREGDRQQAADPEAKFGAKTEHGTIRFSSSHVRA